MAGRFDVEAARAAIHAMREAQQEPGLGRSTRGARELRTVQPACASGSPLRRAGGVSPRHSGSGVRRASQEGYASARESLARDYVRVELAVDRLEVEATAFAECDDCAALVTIRVQGAGAHDLDWLERLTRIYLAWAGALVRRPVELLYECVSNEAASEPLAVLKVDGPFAFGYLKGDAGSHRYRDEERTNDGVRTVSALATIESCHSPASRPTRIPPWSSRRPPPCVCREE